jgi:(R,R)-butanediol dehydrogenase/meso-butanediol dehydrogenase/diacetyl reductase
VNALYMDEKHTLTIGECSPVAPGEHEVMIEVAFAGICGTDLHLYHGHMDKRIMFPHIMGHEMSGVVRQVGSAVTHIAPGDRVTVRPLASCGECPACRRGHSHICQHLKFLGIETAGAFQRYWTVPANTIHKLPDDVSLQIGAMIEPLAVACHDVRLGEVKEGDKTVVIGGGPIGTLIALVARVAGADVLVSELNPFRLQLLQSLGIRTVNPKESDIFELVQQWTDGAGADVVFEVTSSQAGAELMTRLPRTRGRIVIVGIFSKPVPVDLFQFFWKELKLAGARVYESEDFEQAIALAHSGKLPLQQLITDIYPLTEAVKGFEQMEQGAGVMKILLEC